MKRKTVRKAVVAVSIALSVGLMAVSFLLYGLLRGNVKEVSQDIGEYRNWALSEKYTHFSIFPEKIPDAAKKAEYFYKYENGWSRPMCQIYLSYALDPADYSMEEERLSSLSWESKEKGLLTVQKDLDSFQKPAYVTIAGYDFCYEYALMYEEEHTIVYIFSMNTVRNDLIFSQEFLPDYFMEDFEDLSVKGTDRFTMYGGYDQFAQRESE